MDIQQHAPGPADGHSETTTTNSSIGVGGLLPVPVTSSREGKLAMGVEVGRTGQEGEEQESV